MFSLSICSSLREKIQCDPRHKYSATKSLFQAKTASGECIRGTPGLKDLELEKRKTAFVEIKGQSLLFLRQIWEHK